MIQDFKGKEIFNMENENVKNIKAIDFYEQLFYNSF